MYMHPRVERIISEKGSAKVLSSKSRTSNGKARRERSDARCGKMRAIMAPPILSCRPPTEFSATYREWTEREPKLGSLCHGMLSAGPTMTYG
ncbi:hypothetical protein DBV15_05515 [Temnothorax longispinosus]|uniref:Uncharacterized protein n=1 Tax=Temnothorax longispinosus TaxID=300112 RepID=A0A4S2KBP4_9HYME|nr:hypothetical protein DBV15_05515 [Temnothorax longispinosus]